MLYATATQFTQINGKNYMPLVPCLIDGKDYNSIIRSNLDCVEVSETPNVYKKKWFPNCFKAGDNVIIRRQGGHGDVIWTLPVAKKLKEMGCNVKYCTAEKDFPLFENNPHICGHIAKPTISLTDSEWATWIIDYWYSVEGYSPASYKDPYDISYHWAFGTLPEIKEVAGNIFLTEAEKEWAKKQTGEKPYIAIALQSSAPKRSYPYVLEAVKLIIQSYSKLYNIVLLGDRKEADVEGCINMTGKTNLRQLYAIINGCSCLVATDSGNIHIAGQFSKPTVALFSTVKSETRVKYYPKTKAIDTSLPCGGCLQINEHCPIEPLCMAQILPSDILEAMKGII